jgi:hypothetical protein
MASSAFSSVAVREVVTEDYFDQFEHPDDEDYSSEQYDCDYWYESDDFHSPEEFNPEDFQSDDDREPFEYQGTYDEYDEDIFPVTIKKAALEHQMRRNANFVKSAHELRSFVPMHKTAEKPKPLVENVPLVATEAAAVCNDTKKEDNVPDFWWDS